MKTSPPKCPRLSTPDTLEDFQTSILDISATPAKLVLVVSSNSKDASPDIQSPIQMLTLVDFTSASPPPLPPPPKPITSDTQTPPLTLIPLCPNHGIFAAAKFDIPKPANSLISLPIPLATSTLCPLF